MTGASLKALRKSAGLTQQQLSDQAGVNVSLIRKLEGGTVITANITAKNLIALADAFGVDPHDLIQED
ncbi:helix-turn-helix domain-containing protein [Agathobaculum desmolans]|uniref:helix-turn-helix domain-containing protein n=1 Tax=Agathobaculum desmolans TaxID=39484 RepID=UPI00248EFBB1|nr:helix-turn-helix transcriptional regulator [Agathobaculum desmolans]